MGVSTFEAVHEPLVARDVLLGRTTHVRRLVPNKTRRMIGAWCFLDHYGPDDIKSTGGMWVPPHPHTGLQTVTWLFEGVGLHTDSLGSHQLIRPGQLNVMTAGHGICHAEVSPDDAPELLHGVQLWVCLPDPVRDSAPPAFTHLPDLPTYTEHGVTLRVLTGSLAGETSPAPTYSPLVGAELTLDPGSEATLPLESGFEYGVLVAQGAAEVDGVLLERTAMSYLGLGRDELTFRAVPTGPTGPPGSPEEPAVLMLLGGEPFDEEIVMWWNFIGRSHDDIVQYRSDWQHDVIDGGDASGRFGTVADYPGAALPAPALPTVRLKPRS